MILCRGSQWSRAWGGVRGLGTEEENSLGFARTGSGFPDRRERGRGESLGRLGNTLGLQQGSRWWLQDAGEGRENGVC